MIRESDKVIIKSIRPQHVKNILNGDKLLEMDKSAPKEWKDYLSGKTKEKPKPKEVWIYCTKGPGYCYHGFEYKAKIVDNTQVCEGDLCNGNVVAKFTLKKVSEVFHSGIVPNYVLKESCLTYEELKAYFKGKTGYAWHIDNLVILDKPLLLNEGFFGIPHKSYIEWCKQNSINGMCLVQSIMNAPQSWRYAFADRFVIKVNEILGELDKTGEYHQIYRSEGYKCYSLDFEKKNNKYSVTDHLSTESEHEEDLDYFEAESEEEFKIYLRENYEYEIL